MIYLIELLHLFYPATCYISLYLVSYHEGLKKWVEIGNSGMFRPEMLLPMGLPEDVRVIAWGLSLERYAKDFTVVAYGVFGLELYVANPLEKNY